MRRLTIPLVLMLLLVPAGCSIYRTLKNDQDEYVDDYSFIRKEGRGDQPGEKGTDFLTPLLESPEARAINRNLGTD